MKNTDVLSRINALLNINVKLAKIVLEDGTILEVDSFAIGGLVTDAETKAPITEGTYNLEDGTEIQVDATGKITEIEKETELKKPAPDVPPTAMADVPPTIEEILTAIMEALQPKFDDLQAKIEALSKDTTEVKATLSSQIVSKPTTHKPTEVKLNAVKAPVNSSNTEAMIFARLSNFKN